MNQNEEHKCCGGHHHEEGHTCGCGGHGHHHHEHNHDGCCGGHHHHEHNHESCGCGCHDEEEEVVIVVDTNLDEGQLAFLEQLLEIKYLPVARFVVKSSKEDDFASVALAPVFIRDLKDSMADVKQAGTFLSQLENQGMISIDYDMPLNGYTYGEYRNCDLFQFFIETVKEGKDKDGFLGDKATLELGSIALTIPAVEFLTEA
ncbi:MAG: hypothetical protein R3Y62_07965 [Eubacteriales bacterium]